MSPDRFLDRAMIERAFASLAVRLQRRNLTCRVYLFGGGAMVMAFEGRPATRDLDARYTSTSAVQEEVSAVAEEMGMPRSWLNEQGVVYLPQLDDPAPFAVFDHPNLTVTRASDRHLLAMKAGAARAIQDEDDIVALMGRLGITSVEGVVEVHDEVFPDEPLPPRALDLLGQIVSERWGSEAGCDLGKLPGR
ncbi:MAG: hypothetical protein ACRDY2_09395 [Acidimicrobiales bacterium]